MTRNQWPDRIATLQRSTAESGTSCSLMRGAWRSKHTTGVVEPPAVFREAKPLGRGRVMVRDTSRRYPAQVVWMLGEVRGLMPRAGRQGRSRPSCYRAGRGRRGQSGCGKPRSARCPSRGPPSKVSTEASRFQRETAILRRRQPPRSQSRQGRAVVAGAPVTESRTDLVEDPPGIGSSN